MTRSKTAFSLLGAAALAISLTACGDDGGSGANYCDEIEALGQNSMAQVDPSDPDSTSNLAESMQKIADAAPDDIKADWQELADALTSLAEIDITDPEAAAELEKLADLEAVNTRVTDHIASECG